MNDFEKALLRKYDTWAGELFERQASGLLVPKNTKNSRRALYGDKPLGFDFFAGAGGMSLGFHQAGFEIIGAADNDPACFLTYTVNLGADHLKIHFATPEDEERLEAYLEKHAIIKDRKTGVTRMRTSGSNRPLGMIGCSHYFFGDVRKWDGEQMLELMGLEKGDLACVMGGPPCQGFSYAGKREVMDPRNSLVFEFARFVVQMQPATMIMENVPGMINMVTPEGIPVLDKLAMILEEGGIGTADALAKSLAATSGAGAAVLRKKRSSKLTIEDEEQKPAAVETRPAQMSLFEREAA